MQARVQPAERPSRVCPVPGYLSAVSRTDPKPGRWILPLVVAGIVAFTWVFVNALPPAPNATTGGTLATTTTGPDDSGSTTTTEPVVASTTTTTAVPAEVVEFLLRADTVTGAADDLLVEAQEINETWESGRNFTLALNSLRDFDTRTGAFSDSVASASVPDSFATEWEAVQTAASDMAAAASDAARLKAEILDTVIRELTPLLDHAHT